MNLAYKNMTGKTFTCLCVEYRVANKGERIRWHCVCDCGAVLDVDGASLRRGQESCGCLARERAAESMRKTMTKHGHTRSARGDADSPTYQTWNAMRNRCYNSKWHAFKDYGGRGIAICDRWRGEHGFENFLADMGERPQGKTLDRKDVNGNYEKDNCKWSTAIEQRNNRRDSHV